MSKQYAAGAPVIGAASVPAEKPNRRLSERYQALERSKSNFAARIGHAATRRVRPCRRSLLMLALELRLQLPVRRILKFRLDPLPPVAPRIPCARTILLD